MPSGSVANLTDNFQDLELRMQVREKKKESLQKLRFETRIAITAPKILKALLNSKLSLKIEEILNGDLNNRRDVI